MELLTDKVNGVLVIRFAEEGTLEAVNALEFREKMASLIEENNRILLDLGNVLFMDSSGVGALVAISRSIFGRDGELRLIGLTRAVRVVFETTRLYRLFEIFETEEEALAAFTP